LSRFVSQPDESVSLLHNLFHVVCVADDFSGGFVFGSCLLSI
jgi:hypothetical protein